MAQTTPNANLDLIAAVGPDLMAEATALAAASAARALTECPKCRAAWVLNAKFCEACGARPDWKPSAHEALAASVAPAPSWSSVSDAMKGADLVSEEHLEPVAAPTAPACPKCGSTEGADESGFCLNCGARWVLEATPNQSEQALGWRFGAASDIGRRHHENQDAFAIGVLESGFAIVVSDGVSNAQNSSIASSRGSKAALAVILSSSLEEDPRDELSRAVLQADAAVKTTPGSVAQEKAGKAEPQATIVCARVIGAQVALGWAGDSRAYAIGPARARQLTKDDSWLTSAIEGGMDPREAMRNQYAHAITQCLGMLDHDVEPRAAIASLQPGEELLLCSDGLWNYFDEPAMMLAAFHDAQRRAGPGAPATAICKELVAMANERGGIDNITVALLRAPESEPKKAATEEKAPESPVVNRRARIKRGASDDE